MVDIGLGRARREGEWCRRRVLVDQQGLLDGQF